ncbi:MAG: GIY-YIG nuclease family protein, partial [Cyclobacteriaceae bacterium]|nr:GIY-YIG nuclease family protein [Cyclobacteriaceae bacterium]
RTTLGTWGSEVRIFSPRLACSAKLSRPFPMTYIVYILKSLSSDIFYVGQTYDLNKRLAEHNSQMAGFTKKHQPWIVVWYTKVSSRKDALSLEKRIKKRGAKRLLPDLNISPLSAVGIITPEAGKSSTYDSPAQHWQDLFKQD